MQCVSLGDERTNLSLSREGERDRERGRPPAGRECVGERDIEYCSRWKADADVQIAFAAATV